MYNNATFLDSQQITFLKQMDTWLTKQEPTSDEELKVIHSVRELITKIEKQGYYYEGEAELLNTMREQYVKELKSKR